MVDIDTMEVNFIDFGLSTEQENNDYIRAGTPNYAAPEMLEKDKRGFFDFKPLYDKKVDIFSLGRVVSQIWGDYSFIYKPPRELIKPYNNNTLFKEKSETYAALLPLAKDKITNHTTSMLAYEPTARECIDNLIHQFHDAYLDQIYSNVTPFERNELVNDFKRGCELKEKITSIYDFKQFSNTFEDALNLTDDNKNSIQEFTHGLGMHSLQYATSKNEIRGVIETILFNFNAQVKKYNALFKRAQKYHVLSNTTLFSDMKELLLELKHKANAINKRPYDLDLLKRTADNLALKYNYWEERFFEIEDILESSKVFSRFENNIIAVEPPKQLKNEVNVIFDEVLIELQNLLRLALSKYMKKTLTDINITTKDRAASDRRQNDISDFINIINTSGSLQNLKTLTKKKMGEIETGFFGRSKLRDKMKKALEKHEQNHLLLRTNAN